MSTSTEKNPLTSQQEIEELVLRHGEKRRQTIEWACRYLDASELRLHEAGLKLRRTSRQEFIKSLLAKAI